MIAKLAVLKIIISFVGVTMYSIDCVQCSLPSGGLWKQIGLDIDGEAAGDNSGYSVSISADGTTVAIGAQANDANIDKVNAGHVRVYKVSSGNWDQIGQDIDGEVVGDRSGWSVSLSADGTTVAIGAPYNGGTGVFGGHVRVYKISSGSWSQVGGDINGEAANDNFGFSVSLSADGTTIAIGARYNGDGAGHVRVYTISSGNWNQVGTDINGEDYGDNSGFSLSISADGTTLAIGAPYNSESGTCAGHVRIYTISSGNWVQVGKDIDGETAGDSSGWSVSLSADGTTVAIGAKYNNDRAGHVRVYKIASGKWEQIGQDIDGEAVGDQFGHSVSLSADGTTVAIGATENNGNIGHVRVYTLSSGDWNKLGSDIDGESVDDKFGYSLSISADGTKVAIGAPLKDGSGSSADIGRVRVYEYKLPTKSPTNSPTKTPTKSPTKTPTKSPTYTPTKSPTNSPTKNPTKAPTKNPTNIPTMSPTKSPTKSPSMNPTKALTKTPTNAPTKLPTKTPTRTTKTPSKNPTKAPTKSPTKRPVSQAPLPTAPNSAPMNTPMSVPVTVPQFPVSTPLQQIPIPTPVFGAAPIKAPTPIQVPVVTTPNNIPTKNNVTSVPTKSPTKAPIITSENDDDCGLFGLNFFCPRRGECGFWRRLLGINDC